VGGRGPALPSEPCHHAPWWVIVSWPIPASSSALSPVTAALLPCKSPILPPWLLVGGTTELLAGGDTSLRGFMQCSDLNSAISMSCTEHLLLPQVPEVCGRAELCSQSVFGQHWKCMWGGEGQTHRSLVSLVMLQLCISACFWLRQSDTFASETSGVSVGLSPADVVFLGSRVGKEISNFW